ncbi:endo-1,4-beta-xylanase [Clavibacter michiganensis]|uniref:Beta-xylanase n=4 Tax=Clavibacter michiganensis subsp. michiganensis TaxID=33013 RepID=Q7X3X6_CLAMM|nr:endo-1,4-beta-xylanase [Clavibacter michiganensis]AAP57293.1 putative tomatinase TomA [Clavibacter michiganensis subsp. michiganensis NCPPB 382]MDO4019712.1 endo-1,4-beta-xylanase [Clavibacter michiganensis]MDO4039569.1 endo-1,4-beta-xylanase [Clavibacter michiganensis]MDO4051605.1 endo-1,4-beta-xylanase [Clavibacter michiganensis]MDO4064269.1 endo-1,4-beta-xylanase [Clavibacter michiganensis]
MRTLTSAALATTVALGLTLIAAVPARASTGDGPTLRELAEPAGLTIGSGSIKAAEWTKDDRPSNYLTDPRFADTLAEQFNGLSPENEMKWAFTQPEEGVYDFAGLDRLVAFAEEHDMAVKGHGLISSCCDPEYVTSITDAGEMRAAMTEHFTTVMERYDGRIDRWDVVSEALESQGTTLQSTTFFKVLGPGYIADAFRIARAADPDAKLFINENLVEFDAAKRQAFLDLLTGLVAEGVPVDGVALQMHETFAGPLPGVITEMVDSYRALGLDVEIAELDVHTYDPVSQATIYGDVVAEALAAGVTEISTWGFTDKHLYTWLPGAKPLIFDEEYGPKPAYFAVRDALQQFVTPTAAPGVASLSNTGRKSGLSDGDYDIKMNLTKGAPGSYYRLYENDVLVSSQRLDSLATPRQSATTSFSGKAEGKYRYRAELINSQGVTSTKTTTVLVKHLAPSRPVVSVDNRDGDGTFVATATLKSGINATSYAFKLDGRIVGTGPLTAATPNKQTAKVSLTGIAAGRHALTAVFTNTKGSTESRSVTVRVR